jgi:hypothetical protein
MIPRRQPIPIPRWAELPPGEASGGDNFQPFLTGLYRARSAAPAGTGAFGLSPDTQPILRDEDGDAPQLSFF